MMGTGEFVGEFVFLHTHADLYYDKLFTLLYYNQSTIPSFYPFDQTRLRHTVFSLVILDLPDSRKVEI